MRTIGDAFSLELNDGLERHRNAIKLNAGRYALEYILKVRKYNKVYIPYYICDSILQPFENQNVKYEFYHINNQLEPPRDLHANDDEAILWINYFGLKNRHAASFCYTYRNTILDQAQAFYSEHGNIYGNTDIQCDTFYSCRKFFGVPDGAYLYISRHLDENIPKDESFERMTFLTKRIDHSPQEQHSYIEPNEKSLGHIGMRFMSKLTETIMRNIDYTRKANQRISNFHKLDAFLRPTNLFHGDMDYATVPMVYPYLVEYGEDLRQYLMDHNVLCTRYWPYVMEWCQPDDFEYQLAKNLVCLPIDQRYGEEDMRYIISTIRKWETRELKNK